MRVEVVFMKLWRRRGEHPGATIQQVVSDIWIYGYISKYIWIYGYWIYGYRDIWIYFDTYRYIVIGIYGYIEIFRIWIYDVG